MVIIPLSDGQYVVQREFADILIQLHTFCSHPIYEARLHSTPPPLQKQSKRKDFHIWIIINQVKSISGLTKQFIR